ncbi:soluble cytochrome b562 [Vibrio variabilis]|uniref:Soluble cytochrome b562 n=1 Tax=Vibrio variabilis TaxID=990271 RepID=A0ABQ0JQS3_9VIBR|nr:soluble cytochrome b562 [Vibrio variabilis]
MIKTNLISLVALTALVSTSAFAGESFDLKKNMQAMKLAFKQAAEAQSVEEMRVPVDTLDKLIADSKQGNYPPEKADLYQEGFKKLSQAIDEVDSELDSGDLEAAKQSLREVDSLRLEYHDKRNPSIWKRLFG